jgi:hypothetical protein
MAAYLAEMKVPLGVVEADYEDFQGATWVYAFIAYHVLQERCDGCPAILGQWCV